MRSSARTVPRPSPRRRPTDLLEPAFFAEHSLEDLAEHSDYWLGQQGRIVHPMVRRRDATHYEPISWTDAFTLIGETLRGLDDPDQAIFYTSRQDVQRGGVRLPAVRAVAGHQQPARLLEHVPRVHVGCARGDDRHRDGLGQPRGRAHRRPDRDQRAEPRHQPSADAQRAGDREGQRRQDPLDQPAARGRPARFQNPQTVRGLSGVGTRPLRPAPADPRQRRPRALAGDRRRSSSRRTPSTTTSWGVTRRASTSTSPTWHAGLGRGRAGHRPRRRPDPRGGPHAHRRRCDRALLGDGHHPAPQLGRDDQGVRQRRPAAGQHRTTRCGSVPGPRALQRPGRPDDGHLGEGAVALPRRAARRVRLRAPARARPRHRRLHPRAARRQGDVLHGPGRQLRLGHPRHGRHRTGDGERRPDGDGVDQAQPLARALRAHRADPARARPQRARPDGRHRATGHRGGLDVGRALLARPAQAGRPRAEVRGGHRLPDRRGDAGHRQSGPLG